MCQGWYFLIHFWIYDIYIYILMVKIAWWKLSAISQETKSSNTAAFLSSADQVWKLLKLLGSSKHRPRPRSTSCEPEIQRMSGKTMFPNIPKPTLITTLFLASKFWRSSRTVNPAEFPYKPSQASNSDRKCCVNCISGSWPKTGPWWQSQHKSGQKLNWFTIYIIVPLLTCSSFKSKKKAHLHIL